MAENKGLVERSVDRFLPLWLRPLWERILASRVGYRLLHGAFWSTVGTAITQGLMLLMSIVIARTLGREQFGEYGIVMSTVGMFSVVAGFGLGTTATKYVALNRNLDPERAGRVIALSGLVAAAVGVIASLLLVLIAPWLSERSLAAPHLAGVIQIGAALVFFSAINSQQQGALAGFEAFRAIARINILGGIAGFIFVTVGVLTWGLSGALAGHAAAIGVCCILATSAMRSESRRCGIRPSFQSCWSERGVLVSFSLPAILAGLLVSPVTWACSALLVNQPQGYADMGIFNAATSWQKAILFLPGCISVITLPLLSQLHGENEERDFRKALRYNALLNGSAALVVFMVIAICSKLIMASYGASFVSGYPVLILLGLASVFASIATVIGNAMASLGRMWGAFCFNAIWGVVYLALAAIMVPMHGALGLAAANALAYLLHTLLQLAYVRRLIRQEATV